MFASITLQKPFNPQKAVHLSQSNISMQDVYQMQLSLKERIKNFLKDQALFPRELIFISRNMNIVRANNKAVGSPVNRINVMARWAVRGLETRRDATTHDLSAKEKVDNYVRSKWRLLVFDFTLLFMSISFWLVRLRDEANRLLFGKRSQGFEEVLDRKIRDEVVSVTKRGYRSLLIVRIAATPIWYCR